jgi:cytosol alanyl aminopeptidase
VKQNYDKLVALLPQRAAGELARSASEFCDAEHKADAEAFFRERNARAEGGPRILAQVLERISICEAAKKQQQPGVVAFLKKY